MGPFLLTFLLMISGASAQTAQCDVSFVHPTENVYWVLNTQPQSALRVFVSKEGASPSLDRSSELILPAKDFEMISANNVLNGSFRYLDPVTSKLKDMAFWSGPMLPLSAFDLKGCYDRCARRFPAGDGVCRSVCAQTNANWSDYQDAYFEADLAVVGEASFSAKAQILKSCIAP